MVNYEQIQAIAVQQERRRLDHRQAIRSSRPRLSEPAVGGLLLRLERAGTGTGAGSAHARDIDDHRGQAMMFRSYTECCAAEVKWYRERGRYSHKRIARDRDGFEYVIGDQDWNNTCHPSEQEQIEVRMDADLRREYGQR